MSMQATLQSLLCPPGNGVYTVKTGAERKEALQQKLYGATGEQGQSAWQQSLEKLEDTKVGVLGIASDVGGGILHGAAWGPMGVRQALYKKEMVDGLLDLGDVRVIPHLLHDKYLNEETIRQCRLALYGDDNIVLPVSPLSIAEKAMQMLYVKAPNIKIFGIGGDHSCSYPLVKACLEHHQANGRRIGLLHFDAHTDLLTERLGIDICFGSWTSHAISLLKNPQDCVQVGIRATGHDRNHWESTFDIQQIWAREVDTQTSDQIIEHFQQQEVDGLYITFDIDCVDERYVSATGTPESGGMNPQDCIAMIEKIGGAFDVVAADMMEVAPFTCANPKRREQEPESTLAVAADISEALLDVMLRANLH